MRTVEAHVIYNEEKGHTGWYTECPYCEYVDESTTVDEDRIILCEDCGNEYGVVYPGDEEP
jgi:translation initiation factor 2 beta subunit (eIF-2beta)/eIF-5